MKKIITNTFILVLLILFFSDSLMAIPAFARKYRMSCTTCHAPAPRLKAYGEDFAGNGFKLADQDAPRYYMDTGDDDLSLIRDFPIAVRLEGLVTYNNSNSEKSDFNAPYNLKLLSGGAIAPDIAYYFYFYLSEHGEIAGIEDAFIMFNNLFGSELDLVVGQFQTSDPLFKGELRLTFENYLLYRTKIGDSRINLAYDRGIMLSYGFDTGTDIVFQVVNGSGIGEANPLKNFDFDPHKNFVGRVSQDVSDFLRIGAFGYYGKEDLDNETDEFTNEIMVYGPDATLSYEDKVELNLNYLIRNDDQPLSPNVLNEEIETKSALAELIYTPDGDKSKWYAVGLYNWQDSDLAGYEISKLTGHVGWVTRRNIRLFLEVTHDLEMEYTQLGVGFVSAF